MASIPAPRTFVNSLFLQLGSLSQNNTRRRNDAPDLTREKEIRDSESASSSSSRSVSPEEPAPPNPLEDLAKIPSAKTLLATLHCLFPHLLLPALDVLDRRLVTRLFASDDAQPLNPKDAKYFMQPSRVYYVRSKARGTDAGAETPADGERRDIYEVRLRAWNCSCSAFAFAALDESSADMTSGPSLGDVPKAWDGTASFGGLLHTSVPPVCKHLLACTLAEAWPEGFGAQVVDKRVTREEMAGWAAGWA